MNDPLSFCWRLNFEAIVRGFVWEDEHDLRLMVAYADDLGLLARA